MRSLAEATAWAKRQVTHPSQDWSVLCQSFVRQAWGLPAFASSADEAWSESSARHSDDDPPLGAPVFWAIGRYGHVAYSLGDGTILSNDIARRGRIDRVSLGTVSARWGARYRGWVERYGNYTLPLPRPVEPGPHILHLLHLAHIGAPLTPHQQHVLHVYNTEGRVIP